MRRRLGILWMRWYGPHLAIVFLALAVAALYALFVAERQAAKRLIAEMETQTYLAGVIFSPDGERFLPKDQLIPLCQALGAATRQRWTLVNAEGHVLADSHGNLVLMSDDPHRRRPEIRQAFREGLGWSKRKSATVDENLLYVSRRLGDADRPLGVVRVAIPLSRIEQNMHDARRQFMTISAAVLFFALLAGAWVSRRTAGRVDHVRRALQEVAAGDLDYRIASVDSTAIGGMGGEVNTLAARLQSQVEALAVERAYREAILSSMSEGVLVLKSDRRISWLNTAARRLLRLHAENTVDGFVHELIPHAEFLSAVDAAVSASAPTESEARINGGAAVVLWIHAAPLRSSTGGRVGTVFVFSDLTRIRHLERVRQDFVANVSHELKTPLTAIRGVIETLLDGTTHDNATTARFLDIIRRHSESIDRIVNDLLLLSRVEMHAEDTLERFPVKVREHIQRAVSICSQRAAERQIAIEVSCPDDTQILAHPSLVEQALINLLDNAIKYGPAGGQIAIDVTLADEHAVAIAVRDQGPGIGRQHVERIFERFYRIDPGRSRQLGGTGLGLSIVRHIAVAHGGRIEVQSVAGKGSVFTLYLPFFQEVTKT